MERSKLGYQKHSVRIMDCCYSMLGTTTLLTAPRVGTWPSRAFGIIALNAYNSCASSFVARPSTVRHRMVTQPLRSCSWTVAHLLLQQAR